MCPFGRSLINGDGGLLSRGRLVCHVLLVELDGALALVDTGFGTGDVDSPRQLGPPFVLMTQPQLTRAETAIEQVRALGFDPPDVRHIILTHLDVDHAGGLPDFPDAEVHVFEPELAVMQHPPLSQRPRYTMGSAHFKHGPQWRAHAAGGDAWFGFESIRVLPGSDEVALVPLQGHTLGHTGVAVRRDSGWLLHCGDAYFHRGEVQTPPQRPVGLEIFQTLMQADGGARHRNQERLRELARSHGDEVELICSHDPVTLEAAQRAT
jgi:glyoxylase-like metal-dependent hydrolase (beta-lactamase superfamily II)